MATQSYQLLLRLPWDLLMFVDFNMAKFITYKASFIPKPIPWCAYT